MDGKGPTEQLVSPEPEFYVKTRDADNDEFLVLACDGVWDVMTNEDICSFIADRMRVTDDLETIANEVIDTCLHKVSRGSLFVFPSDDPQQNVNSFLTSVFNTVFYTLSHGTFLFSLHGIAQKTSKSRFSVCVLVSVKIQRHRTGQDWGPF